VLKCSAPSSHIEVRNERRHAEIHALRNNGLTITAIAD
jgi:hypothetical protein